MFENVDWTHRGQYMFEKHGVTVAQANEALRDPERVVITLTTTARAAEACASSATRSTSVI